MGAIGTAIALVLWLSGGWKGSRRARGTSARACSRSRGKRPAVSSRSCSTRRASSGARRRMAFPGRGRARSTARSLTSAPVPARRPWCSTCSTRSRRCTGCRTTRHSPRGRRRTGASWLRWTSAPSKPRTRSGPPMITVRRSRLPVSADWIRAVHPRRLSFPLAEFPIPEVFKSANILANAYLAPEPRGPRLPARASFQHFRRAGGALRSARGVRGRKSWRARFFHRAGRTYSRRREDPDRCRGPRHPEVSGPLDDARGVHGGGCRAGRYTIQDGKEPAVPLASFKDKYVFFGFSAPGLFDLKPSPMTGDYPGVEIHATMLDNILSGDFMRPVPAGATILLLVLLCVGAALAASASRAGLTAIVYVIFIPIAPALGIAAYAMGTGCRWSHSSSASFSRWSVQALPAMRRRASRSAT